MGRYHQYTFNNIERESRMQIIFPSQKFINYNNQSLKSSATSTVFMLVGVRQPAWTYAGLAPWIPLSSLIASQEWGKVLAWSHTGSFHDRHSHSLSTCGFQIKWRHTLLKGSLIRRKYKIAKEIWIVARSLLQRCYSPPAIMEEKHSESQLETQHLLPSWPTRTSTLFN